MENSWPPLPNDDEAKERIIANEGKGIATEREKGQINALTAVPSDDAVDKGFRNGGPNNDGGLLLRPNAIDRTVHDDAVEDRSSIWIRKSRATRLSSSEAAKWCQAFNAVLC